MQRLKWLQSMANLWHADLLETTVPELNATPKLFQSLATLYGVHISFGTNTATFQRLQSLTTLWHTDMSWRQQCQGEMPRLKGSNHWPPFGIQTCPADNSARVKCHS